MTKKTVSLILIFAIFFSVIAMAVWGKVPETTGDVYVTSMVFLNQDGQEVTELNDSEEKEKKITLQRDETATISYIFQVVLLPANATDLSIDYIFESGDATIEVLEYRPLGDGTLPGQSDSSEAASSSASSQEGEVSAPANVYTYRITFTHQNLTTISFFSNFSGTRRIKDYLMFAFEGSSHSGDIIL